MRLPSQAQQTVLAISSYLIILLFNTSDSYCKTLTRKVYSDTLKKYLYGILDYAKVEVFLSSLTLSNSWALPISSSGIQQSLDGP